MTLGPDAVDEPAITRSWLRRRATAKWTRFTEDVIPMWIAEMDFPTAPVVLEAIRAAVEREEFGYLGPETVSRLSRAVAAFSERRYGWRVDADRVHLVPHVLKGVELGIARFTPERSPVILPTPSYPPFFEVPMVINRPLVEIPMSLGAEGYGFDLEAIDRAFANGAGAIIVCQPHNPLGRSFRAEELRALASVVARHHGRVVSDEIHAPLTYGRAHVPYASVSDEASSHALTLTSASKGWNVPGLACAVAITSNGDDERRWREMVGLDTHGASTLGVAANIAAFESGESWLDENLARLDRNRHLLGALLAKHLPGVGYRMPEATYLAWLDFSALHLDQEPAAFFLEQAKVAMNPGSGFGIGAREFARLNFATTRALLEEALEAMGNAISSS